MRQSIAIQRRLGDTGEEAKSSRDLAELIRDVMKNDRVALTEADALDTRVNETDPPKPDSA